MKKKLLSLALVLAMCLGLCVPAFAAEISNTAGENLTKGERRIYEEMKNAVLDIAAGKRTSTEITISFADRELGWTARELGFTGSIHNDYALEPVRQKLNESLSKAYVCIEYDFPFELFFALYNAWSCTFQWWNTGSELWLKEMTCSLAVSPDFRGGSEFMVSSTAISQAVTAKANARAIVKANEGKSNYEKLAAYRDAICELTDYDDEKLSVFGTDAYIYGRQCQAVSVFDGDPYTKTVCEGYSKAFKYLCDLSSFDGDVQCYLAEGVIDEGALGSGPHMWNVVRMEDGNYYLTDVTVYDSGVFGYNVPLLACASENPANYNYQQALYTYADYQYGLFTNGCLPISATPYEPGRAVTTPAPTPSPATNPFTDVKAGDYFADPVLWAVEKEITGGTSKTTFSPNQNCTVAQILTFLWRANGSPKPVGDNPLSDVKSSDYYADAAAWAYEKGMVSGGTFGGNTPCTRSMAVTYMWKAAGGPSNKAASFADVPVEADYAQAVAWAVEKEITGGTSATTFSPDTVCTRGQIVTFLYRWLAK